MNTKIDLRPTTNLKRWANGLPYVNGGLFSGSVEVPKFTKIARAYLLHIGQLDWKKINPDVFGSMIQAVADDEERGSLGMHYTSVPNILKVLNPLFLDDLRQELEAAQDNKRKLTSLSKRMSKIRVFDPACGSGNFLVIAYKQMREIEAEVNIKLQDSGKRTIIPLTNFRGIELRDFPAEIARLALIIAEYQCDVLYRGQREALATFLPLDTKNWITQGNALQLDWLSVYQPTGTTVKLRANDLFHTPLDQAEIDFENEGGETYICGNPPYLGSTWQSKEQKQDLKNIFDGRTKSWKSLDYVAGWFMKAADYGKHTNTVSAFVSTNSICQGQQVPILWPLIFETGHEISFAHTSFKWANLASHNAGVTVAIIAITNQPKLTKNLYYLANDSIIVKQVENINAYLVAGSGVIVKKQSIPLSNQAIMKFGNKPVDGGNLLLSSTDVDTLSLTIAQKLKFIRRIYGSAEFIRGIERYVLWIEDETLDEAMNIDSIKTRIEGVKTIRLKSRDKSANEMAKRSHQMREMNIGNKHTIVVPAVSSEERYWFQIGLIDSNSTITNRNFGLYDACLILN